MITNENTELRKGILYQARKKNIISSQEKEYDIKPRKGKLYQAKKKNIILSQEKE